MTTPRPVRDDQHGTITGYQYGCRCSPCALARRQYARDHGDSGGVSAETVELVLAALEREADMDDVATASSVRLGELVGISAHTANMAVHVLAEQGRIEIAGTIGRGGVLEIHLGVTS